MCEASLRPAWAPALPCLAQPIHSPRRRYCVWPGTVPSRVAQVEGSPAIATIVRHPPRTGPQRVVLWFLSPRARLMNLIYCYYVQTAARSLRRLSGESGPRIAYKVAGLYAGLTGVRHHSMAPVDLPHCPAPLRSPSFPSPPPPAPFSKQQRACRRGEDIEHT